MNSIQNDPYIAAITPPSFSLALMRIDTAFTALSDGMFKIDCEWFKKHSKRRLLIRREGIGEFDPRIVPHTHPAFNICLDKPPLWVLVMRLMQGTHLVIPVYRGAAFWQEVIGDYQPTHFGTPAVSTDDEVANLLIEMQRCNGVDLNGFKEWFVRYVKAIQEPKQLSTSTGMVN